MAETIQTDVLVVGGGLAGFRAAMRARDFVDRVTLAEKATVARGGGTVFCHIMTAPTPAGARDDWLRDIVEHTEYFSNQEWAETVLGEQGERVKELEEWGFEFEKDEKGDFILMPPRGAEVARAIYYEGRKFAERMRDVLLARGINLIERLMIIDLLTSDGEHPSRGSVIGAVGLHTRTGEPLVIKAHGLVVTNGLIAGKLKDMDNLTGDGQAMAFRAGAELSGMEFTHQSHFSLWKRDPEGKGLKYLWSGAQFQNHGAWIVNTVGERIMERYAPQLMERRSGFGRISQAIAKECLEGRGPVYFSMRHFPQEEVERLRKVIPQTMAALDDGNIDILKDLIEVIPMVSFWGGGRGGIKIGHNGDTTLPGLFAAGMSAQTRASVEPMASLSQAFCNVFGYRAGEAAGRYAAGSADATPKQEQVEGLLKRIVSPLKRGDGVEPDDIFHSANKLIVPFKYGILKSEARIMEALDQLERIEGEDLPRVRAGGAHDLIKANEARNYLLLCRLSYRAAFERKETRLCHYREEYPFRDDINWLKWITLKREREDIKVGFEPIPIESYKIRPASRAKVPAAVQFSSESLKEVNL